MLQRKELNRRRAAEEREKQKQAEEQERWNAELRALREKVQGLASEVAEQDAAAGETRRVTEELQAEHSDLLREVAANKEAVEEMTGLRDAQETRAREAKDRYDGLQMAIDEIRAKAESKDTQLEKLTSALGKQLHRTSAEDATLHSEVRDVELPVARQVQVVHDRLTDVLNDLMDKASSGKPLSPGDEDQYRQFGRDLEGVGPLVNECIGTVQEARRSLSSLAELLAFGQATNMHSALEPTTREALRGLRKDQLLILLDCLAFDPAVTLYLQSELCSMVDAIGMTPGDATDPHT